MSAENKSFLARRWLAVFAIGVLEVSFEGTSAGATRSGVCPPGQEPAPARVCSFAQTRSRRLGPTSILVIRVDFPDFPGDPGNGLYTAAYVQDIMDRQLGPFFERSSYRRASLKSTVTARLYRMPQQGTYYAAGYVGMLLADAEAAACPDFVLANFDRIVVLFPSLRDLPDSQVQYDGWSAGERNIWINGRFEFRVVAHELGHTYGLWHANVWQVNDGNPTSDTGSSADYGDLFDTMSGNWGNDLRTDFNPWFKYELHWIDDDQVQTLTKSGIYRVNRFDSPSATGTLALKVAKDGARDYWISCRRNFTDNASMQHGAYIIWGYHMSQHSDLLDLTTPGANVRDAALAIGASLVDSEAGLAITPVAEGGSPPNEYLDVQVTFGQIPPIMTAGPSGQWAVPGQTAVFVAGAVGIPAPGFQWERLAAGSTNWVTLNDGGDYGGCATRTLLVSGATLLMDGDQFRCLFSNLAGSISSPPARLTVVTSGVVTLAGQAGILGYADGLGWLARFSLPQGVTVDSGDNVYVVDSHNCVIRRISAAGVVSTVAGRAGSFGTADGIGSEARFLSPCGIAADAGGNLYVADAGNHTVRRITSQGVVTTLAGSAGHPGSADGAGDQARFYDPSGIAVGCRGNLYVTDRLNHTIREITPEGTVSTIAGTAGEWGAVDGNGSGARFNEPLGLATDSAGNIYVADQGFSTIRKITPVGQVSTLAGLAGAVGSADGTGNGARFNFPTGVAVDARGNLFVADQGSSTIRRVTPAGVVTTVAGLAGSPGSLDGSSEKARFSSPFAVAIDGWGHLYVTDTEASTIRRVLIASAVQPMLQITLSAPQVVLSWPAWARDFVLETTSQSPPAATWLPQTNLPALVNHTCILTNRVDHPARFYRLHKRPEE